MAAQQELAGIIKGIQDDVRTIVRGEIELVKAEIVPQAKSAGIGAGLIGGAAYLAITAGTLLFLALSFLLSAGFMSWFGLDLFPAAFWGFTVMAVLLALVAGILALVARQRMVFTPPQAAIDFAQGTTQSVTAAVKDAYQEANSLSLTGKPTPPRQPELE
ncbi:MAG: phage holin family protein [Propionicimonas sp.]|nr:phage holin family protein [Propionicimonas sp.]